MKICNLLTCFGPGKYSPASASMGVKFIVVFVNDVKALPVFVLGHFVNMIFNYLSPYENIFLGAIVQ